MTVRCQSEAARRLLLDHLTEHDPDMAALFSTVEAALGPVAELRYTGPTEQALRDRLQAARGGEKALGAHAARPILAGGGRQPV